MHCQTLQKYQGTIHSFIILFVLVKDGNNITLLFKNFLILSYVEEKKRKDKHSLKRLKNTALLSRHSRNCTSTIYRRLSEISRIAIRLFDSSRKLPRFDRDLVIRVAVSFESPLIQNTGLIGRSKNDDRLARGLRGIYRDS